MTKLFSSLALAGLMTGAMILPGHAQTAQRMERSMERGMKSVTSQPNAPLKNSMTQAQARKACQAELRGGRESKAAMRKKMQFCINDKMQGNS